MTPYNIKELTWEKWKRFYLNEPLIRNSKGTLNSIRYAMNVFGIPPSMYYFAEMIKSGYGVNYESAIRNNTREYYITKNLYGLNITKDKSLFLLSDNVSTITKPSFKTTNTVNSLCVYFSINWKELLSLNLVSGDTFDMFIASQSQSTKENINCRLSIVKVDDNYYWRLSHVMTLAGGSTTSSNNFDKLIDLNSINNGIYCLFINLYEDVSYEYTFDLKLSHLDENNELVYDWEEAQLMADWDYQMWNDPVGKVGLMFGSEYSNNSNVYNIYGIKMFWVRPSDSDLMSHAKNPKQYYDQFYENNMCLYIDLDNPRNMSIDSPHTKPGNITKSIYPLSLESLTWGNDSISGLTNGWDYEAYWPYNFIPIETKVKLYSYSSMTLVGDKVRIIDRDTTNTMLPKASKLEYENNIEKDNYFSNVYMLFSNMHNIDLLISQRYDSDLIRSSMVKPQDFYSSSYSTLDQERQMFFSTWNIKNLTPNWNSVANSIDPDIWSVVKKLSPVRSEIIGGYYIAPHMLERSKMAQIAPTIALEDSNSKALVFDDIYNINMSVSSSELSIIEDEKVLHSELFQNYQTDILPQSNVIASDLQSNLLGENTIMDSGYSSNMVIAELPNYNQQRYEPSFYLSPATSPRKLKDNSGDIILNKKQLYDRAFNPYIGCRLLTSDDGKPPVQIKILKVKPVIKVDKKIGGTVDENRTTDLVQENPIYTSTPEDEKKVVAKTGVIGIPKFVPSADLTNDNEKKI